MKTALLAMVLSLVTYMPAPVMTSGFEKGADSNQWAFHGTSFDTTNPLSGKRSLLLNPNSAQQYADTEALFAGGVYVIRCRIRFDSLPTQDVWLVAMTAAAGIRFDASDGKVYAGAVSGNGATGVSVTTGVVYVIDFKVDTTSSPWLVDGRVNGVDLGQWAQPSPAYSDPRLFRIGNFNFVTLGMVVDDFALSTTASDYPIGF